MTSRAPLATLLLLSLAFPAAAQTPRVGIPTFAGGLPELRYRWKEGTTYAYRVHIEAEIIDTIRTHDGVLSFTARANKPQAGAAKETSKPTATATAFAVTADGYLLTCAHVVEGASNVEVALLGKTHKAKVVATDVPNDLALLKVEAQGLPVLPLANSDQIEVGQEIRAIGFPLSSVLGDSLKAVRGTVSGIDQREGRKRFQIDAGVNPGNSGGPLVNEQGEVVGITSAKLTGSAVSNVGFGVPVNYAQAMLGKQKVTATGKTVGSKLDGPALVRTVSPSVALVTITLRDGVAAGGDLYTLRYNGRLSESERQKTPQRLGPGSFPRPPRPPSMRPPTFGFGSRQADEVQVDVLGNIQESQGGESLPYMLGNAVHLILEPLSEHGEDTWEVSSSTTIFEREKEDDRFGFMRRRFGPPGFAAEPEPEGTKYPATERTEYRIAKKEGHMVVLHKSYELKCDTKGFEQPYLQLTGEADITFDLQEGVPVEMSYKGAVSVNKQNVSVKIPITFTYKKLSAAEVKAPPAVAATPAQPAQPGVAPAKPDAPAAAARPVAAAKAELSDAEIEQNLAKLKSDKFFERHQAAGVFQKALPTEARRAEVARGLETAAQHDDLHTRMNALKALAVWGSAESVPVLLACLERSDPFTRNDALDALALFGDERAIEPVMARFKDFSTRGKATAVLKKIGAPCETALAKMLGEEKDIFLRKDICELLKTFGTKSSLPALESAVKDSNPFVSNAAQAALTAISQR